MLESQNVGEKISKLKPKVHRNETGKDRWQKKCIKARRLQKTWLVWGTYGQLVSLFVSTRVCARAHVCVGGGGRRKTAKDKAEEVSRGQLLKVLKATSKNLIFPGTFFRNHWWVFRPGSNITTNDLEKRILTVAWERVEGQQRVGRHRHQLATVTMF